MAIASAEQFQVEKLHFHSQTLAFPYESRLAGTVNRTSVTVIMNTRDFQEGLDAFKAKQKPSWEGI
jgi:hypothetical protein